MLGDFYCNVFSNIKKTGLGVSSPLLELLENIPEFGFNSIKLWPEFDILLCMSIHCVCSTKTCPTTGWTGWAFRPPCTETRTAPGPCRQCTSTTGPSCTPTSTRTPPTPTPCLPVWAPRLTTLSREIKTLYTGRCKPPLRRQTHSLVWHACIRAEMGQSGWVRAVAEKAPVPSSGRLCDTGVQTATEALGQREKKRERELPQGLPPVLNTLDLYAFKSGMYLSRVSVEQTI